MNPYLLIILVLILFDVALGLLVDRLNLRRLSEEVPDEFKGWYDAETYRKARAYERETTRFDAATSLLVTPATVAFLLCGGFAAADRLARSAECGLIVTGLLFAGMLVLLSHLVHLPFSIYSTFVIEDRYGFNKTTPRTFIADELKGWLLTIVIGGPLFAGVLWFFSVCGARAWWTAWLALCLVQTALLYLAPAVILPLFNKFTPLPDGLLKDAITRYAHSQAVSLKGIFTMDGSRRSTRANAYFTGFGRWRRLVLFDTLVQKHTVAELTSVLAHEVGHYKLRHVHQHLLAAFLSSGLMFYILSFFIARPGLYEAFGLEMLPVGGEAPLYAGMIFFGFLYTPISTLLGIATNLASRRHEHQADRFAVRTFGQPEAMVSALKRLTVDNLGNLTPHPLKVFLEYSHPPVLDRIRAIRSLATGPSGGPC